LGNLEKHSSHPIAQALASAFGAEKNPSNIQFKEIKEEKGFGVIATDKLGNKYSIGSAASVKDKPHEPNHQAYVLMNGEVLAWIDFNDGPRAGAKETITYFNNQGIRTILLSGDTASKCEELAATLGIKEVHSGQLPTQKVEFIRTLQQSNKVAMVGDGINDAAALAESWVGIAMGSGTQIAMQSADVLLVKPHDLQILVKAHALAGASIRTIHQNLFWALIYNVIAIPIAGAGLLSPMIASFSMAFSDVVVIGNSLRLRFKKILFTK
jgi:Cu+-exporting ATPase